MTLLAPEIYLPEEVAHIDPSLVPGHLAFILDGNRRWAVERGLSHVEGHKAGAKALAQLIRPAVDLGIQTLTVYGFSTENWYRSEEEVQALLQIIEEHILKEQQDALENRVRLDFIGDLSELPASLYQLCQESRRLTKGHERATLVIALNYGGRDEIIRAMQKIANQVRRGQVALEEVSPQVLVENMDFREIGSAPDMLIRTSGESRVSNFLLWHLAETEFYQTEIYWPEFDRYALLRAVSEYQRRVQRKHDERL